MSAADETVILPPRDVAEVQRVAADRVDTAIRQHRGSEVADLRAELVRRGRRIATLETLVDRLNQQLRHVRDERDGMRAELDSPVFETLDDVADWLRSEAVTLGARAHIKTGGDSRVVTMRTDLGVLILTVRPARRGLVWIQTAIERGMGEMLDELIARGRFDRTDNDYSDWCVSISGEPKP